MKDKRRIRHRFSELACDVPPARCTAPNLLFRKSYARRQFATSLGLILLLLLGPQDAHADGFEKIIRAIKGVAWAALSTGLDEAGARLLGPTTWRIVKSVGEPALKELYPQEGNLQRTEVTRVVYYLDSDNTLRQNIRQRFDALPRDERDAVVRKIDEIQDQLFRIENLATDTNLDVKEIKQLLLSVLRTQASSVLPTAVPKELHRFDPDGSLLSIYYPRGLIAPVKDGDLWVAGINPGDWKNLLDDFKRPPVGISFWVVGAPPEPDPMPRKKLAMDEIRRALTGGSCDEDQQQFIVQEREKRGFLFAGMCDRTWPIPNTYAAVRFFYSYGALVLIRAFIVGDDIWEEYEEPLLASMRLTTLRGACGFYGTACCIPTGARACEAGLRCRNEQCLPPLPTEEQPGKPWLTPGTLKEQPDKPWLIPER